MALFDAHNHLQSEVFKPFLAEIFEELEEIGCVGAAVNGTCAEDWPVVAQLAEQHPWIAPQFGYHPWWVSRRPKDWRDRLEEQLLNHPNAGVGEIGLDCWVADHDLRDQMSVLEFELEIAARLERPVTLHCLHAWEPLTEMVWKSQLAEERFLVHACGAPAAFARRLLDRGAYFSFPGSFLAARKRSLQAFMLTVPATRLLVETDAPSLPLPENLIRFRVPKSDTVVLGEKPTSEPNHPANIKVTYAELAQLRGVPVAQLEANCEANYTRLFSDGSISRR